jgi:hypothetical protein
MALSHASTTFRHGPKLGTAALPCSPIAIEPRDDDQLSAG